jgi:hypothetical protein
MTKNATTNEAPVAEAPTEPVTVTIYRPVKDLNGFTIGYEPVQVPVTQAETKVLPGGLAGKPNFTEA